MAYLTYTTYMTYSRPKNFVALTAHPHSDFDRTLVMDTTNSLNIEDPEPLLRYLHQTGRVQAAETPRISQLAGGISNRTVLVERAGGVAFVLKQALPKLRVATDWPSDPRRIHQEALGLTWLRRLGAATA